MAKHPVVSKAKLSKQLLGGYRLDFSCPACNGELNTKESQIGKDDDCSLCGAVFLIGQRDVERNRELTISFMDEGSRISDEQNKVLDEWAKNNEDVLKFGEALNDETNKAMVEARIIIRKSQQQIAEARGKILDARTLAFSSRGDIIKLDIQARLDIYKNIVGQSSALINTGIWIALLGFAGWFFRVQKYHDRIIRAEAAKAERDAAPPESPPKWYL